MWSVILPAAGTNQFANPSAERDTSGYAVVNSATLARTPNAAYAGVWGLAVTPGSGANSGVAYGSAALTPSSDYVASAYVQGGSAGSYRLSLYSPQGAELAGTTWTASGLWERITFPYANGTFVAASLRVAAPLANGTAFSLDAIQLEPGTVLTTYIDGDQPGCSWGGVPHAAISIRGADTGAGGQAYVLGEEPRVLLVGMSDVGMPPIQNNVQTLAGQDRALFQRAIARPRTMTLSIIANGTSLASLHAIRDTLIRAVAPDRTPTQQAMGLRYTLDGREIGVDGHYDSGLELGQRGLFAEMIALRIVAPDPYWYSLRSVAGTVAAQGTIPNSAFALERANSGGWAPMTGLGGPVFALATYNNQLWAGGTFSSYAARRDGGTVWTTFSGLNNAVHALAFDAGGTAYVAGQFTGAGGTGVARLSAGAWTIPGNAGGVTRALAIDWGGTIWAGGDYGIKISTNGGGNWGTIGPGSAPSGTVFALSVGRDGLMYAGGVFAHGNVARYGTAWSTLAMGTALGTNGPIYSLLTQRNGMVIAGGSFSLAGGGTANNLASWDGGAWSAFDVGTNGPVYSLTDDRSTQLWVGGSFTTAGGYTMPTGLALWGGAAFYPLDVTLPTPGTTPTVRALAYESWRSSLAIGYTTNGTASVAAAFSATNEGSTNAYPVVTVTGPGRLYRIDTSPTGESLFFDLSVLSGETVTISLVPGSRGITSTVRGAIPGVIRAGSDDDTWHLHKGSNTVLVYADNSAMQVSVQWRPRYWSIDGVTTA